MPKNCGHTQRTHVETMVEKYITFFPYLRLKGNVSKNMVNLMCESLC